MCLHSKLHVPDHDFCFCCGRAWDLLGSTVGESRICCFVFCFVSVWCDVLHHRWWWRASPPSTTTTSLPLPTTSASDRTLQLLWKWEAAGWDLQSRWCTLVHVTEWRALLLSCRVWESARLTRGATVAPTFHFWERRLLLFYETDWIFELSPKYKLIYFNCSVSESQNKKKSIWNIFHSPCCVSYSHLKILKRLTISSAFVADH